MNLESFRENEITSVTAKGILLAEETNLSVLVEVQNKDEILEEKQYHITFAFKNSKPKLTNQLIERLMESSGNKLTLGRKLSVKIEETEYSVTYMPCERKEFSGIKKYFT